ncbi:AAA domain-containing protein [Nitratidesulfovibrio liaohensis]|uniref:AAA domain-containing protein n=1 Tax=Nitratidesulfovibrio liaohensis TaxID=2604158 RepID=A0ABY9QYG7_9BACT|nr:AAA domain-containing protein [Nitratidesulfovibrio liaohensis]WMW64219.1 AAA domain-containing protein [Nitratidesulfovibrio liaohensis]
MRALAHGITRYFRDTLADELILDEVDGGQGGKSYVSITDEQFRSGTLPHVIAEQILGSAPEQRLLVAPVQFKRGFLRGARYWDHPEVVTPMLVPCVLYRDGRLSAQERIMPWFIRDYLDPVVSKTGIVFTSVDAVEEYIARNSQHFAQLGWERYHEFCTGMLQELIGFDEQGKVQLGDMPYFACREPRAYLDKGQSGAASNIKKLYDAVLKREELPAAYRNFVTGCPKPRPLLTLEEEADVAARMHLGQMSGAFGLGPSQRETIHHFLSTGDGEVLAVNGPPGTGKTTLLQSAIASLWVKAVMDVGDGRPEPPVIVATSSNNQAVTNVIRDFGGVLKAESANPLEVRWLPAGVDSLGAYAVSDAKQKELDKEGNPFLSMALAWVGGGYELKGFFERVETPEYVEQALSDYLGHYARFSGTPQPTENPRAALAAIRADLRARMLRVADTMQQGLAAWTQCLHDCARTAEVDARRREIAASLVDGQARAASVVDALARVAVEQDRVTAMAQEVATAIAGQSLGESLLGAMGFVKDRLAARAKAFVLQHRLELPAPPKNLGEVGAHVDALLEAVRTRHHALSAELEELARAEEQLRQEDARQAALLQEMGARRAALAETLRLAEDDLEFTRLGLYSLLDRFDRTARFEMFLLAVHYYEGLWLEDVSDPQRGRIHGADRLKRIAMLTPCIVSTLFMVPKFFATSGGPLYEFIDLLILDEAGQAGPDKAAAVFALARRGLVVGDVHQIEPVYRIPTSVDLGNMRRHGIHDGSEEDMPTGLAASKGSAMRMAQDASPYHCILNGRPAEERGMYLLEHRRCHKDIIGYCKELVYPHLEVLTRQEPDDFYLFPPLGYAHIPSTGRKKNGSWHNPYEARNIAQWLADNRDRILDRYKAASLADIVAIVTPFASQVQSIRASMRECLRESDHADMVVGTVHRLQGAERPIVLFSSVYGPGNVAVPFFDRGRNMLNVAVSRAKHSFLVFGNMGLFEPGGGRPSQILGKHLQCVIQGGELEDFRLAPRPMEGRIEHLTTLEQHRAALRRAFDTVRERLVIVSPFLGAHALDADGVLEMVRATCGRGAAVEVYSDARLALAGCQNRQDRLDEVARALEAAGARLKFVNGLHNKTLIVDDHTLVEGSFNWLSARRDGMARKEHSILYQGCDVSRLREELLQV